MKLVIAQMKHETNTFSPVPTPLEDALANMKVIERVLQSARENRWA